MVAETRRFVQASIGEVLDPKAGIGVRKAINANPRDRDDLNRPPEVLCAERVVTEESSSSFGVGGKAGTVNQQTVVVILR
jgi:hypothetical protein